MEMNPEGGPKLSKEQFDPGRKFTESGGKILEYDESGQPIRWKCGIGRNDEQIHPAGIKDAICYLNQNKEWEAGHPNDEQLNQEKEHWEIE